jgi:hypothetical protein
MTVFCICGPEDDSDINIQAGWDFLRKDREDLQRGAMTTTMA